MSKIKGEQRKPKEVEVDVSTAQTQNGNSVERTAAAGASRLPVKHMSKQQKGAKCYQKGYQSHKVGTRVPLLSILSGPPEGRK